MSEKWEIKKTCSRQTKKHVQKILRKLRNEALEKYGVLAEDEKSYSFLKEGSLENFNLEVSELLNKEIEY